MTGRGSVIMRGVATIEEIRKDREAIIIHSIPYQLNKAALVERIAELVREKRIEGISDLRDESDRQGMRIVIEMKRDASADVILDQLYRYTPLLARSSFGVNMLALNRGQSRPEQMGLLAEGHGHRLRGFPRGGGGPADRSSSSASPATASHVLVGSSDRRRQHRRVHPHHPFVQGSRPQAL